MARKSQKTVFAEPEVSDEEPQEETAIDHQEDEGTGDGRSISKAEAARRTLAEGIELPRKASVHIKERYGLDISPQQFSAEKSRLKQRHGGSLPGGFAPTARPAASLSASSAQVSGEPGLLEALEAIKPLIATLGADKVKRMVDLLG